MEFELDILKILFGKGKKANILTLDFTDSRNLVPDSYRNRAPRGLLSVAVGSKKLALRSEMFSLPFFDNAFDIVIIKGFSDAVHLTKRDQEAVFQHIFRILTTDGIFYLAFKNKFSPTFWGQRTSSFANEGSKCWTNSEATNRLLDRWCVTRYHHFRQLSFRGYIRLLQDVGFRNNILYGGPFGSNSACVISLEANVNSFFHRYLDSRRSWLKKQAIRITTLVRLNRYLCNSYVLIASKKENFRPKKIIEDSCSKWTKEGNSDEVRFIIAHKTCLLFRGGAESPFTVVKYSKCNDLIQEFSNLKRINQLLPDETPSPLFCKRWGEYYLLGQAFKPGTRLDILGLSAELLNKVFDLLIKFHRATYRGTFRLERQHMVKLIKKQIRQFAKIHPAIPIEGEIESVMREYSVIETTPLPFVSQHCDFAAVNILFDHSSGSISIVDWADFGKTYLPLYDVVLFIISWYPAPDDFHSLFETNTLSKILLTFMSNYMKEFHIGSDWIRLLFPVALVTFFNQNYPHRMAISNKIEQLIAYYLENKEKIIFGN